MNKMDDQVFQTVTIQLKALGFVKIDTLKSTDGKTYSFWKLTDEGERVMVELRSIKKVAPASTQESNDALPSD